MSDFEANGFALLPDLLDRAECAQLSARASAVAGAMAGNRCLLQEDWCAALAQRLRTSAALAPLLPPDALAVQCTYFEKSAEHNWLVPIHQDLSIPVAERVDTPGWRGWSIKDGVQFVQPPAALLDQLVAVRLHLDDCGAGDGPLRLVAGSHRQGTIAADHAIGLRDAQGEVVCAADAGTVLVMRPLLLHASSKSNGSSRRRVLHFVFGPRHLPQGLAWNAAV